MTEAHTLTSNDDCLWSSWSAADQALYEQYFRVWGQEGAYESNFAYVQQECRDRAWKFVRSDLLLTACMRGDDSAFVFLLPPIGSSAQAVQMLPRLCADLAHRTRRRVILRKLLPDMHAALVSTGSFKDVPLDTYQNPRELPEDIHAQVVASTRRANEFVGSSFVKVRNKIRAAHAAHQIWFCDLDPSNSSEVIDMIATWASEQNERLRKSTSTGVAPIGELGIDPAAYTIFCNRFAGQVDNALYFGRVMIVDGQVSAFSFSGRTSSNSAGLYASICRLRSRGASDCMIADMLDVLAQNCIELLNLGGSEGLDLFRFKKKWGTTDFIETRELEFTSNQLTT